MSTDLRELIWEGLLTAKLNVCYWKSLRKYYERIDLGIRISILITSSTAVASWAIWSHIYPVWQVLTGITTILAILSPVLNYPKLVGKSGDLYGRWVLVHHNWETLWTNLSLGVEVTVEKYHEVRDQVTKLEVEESEMSEKESIKEKCEQEVRKSVSSEA